MVGAKDEDTGQAVCAFVIPATTAGDGATTSWPSCASTCARRSAPSPPPPDHDRPEAAQDPLGQIIAACPRRRRAPARSAITTLADSTVMDLIGTGERGQGEDPDPCTNRVRSALGWVAVRREVWSAEQ